MMQNQEVFQHIYSPPFFIHKVFNYQKAVYQRKGHWTQKEKVKYGVFLQVFRKKFEDRENSILNKMFRVMSEFIKTRNHNQCRSHHQKMERERYQIDSILESIRSKYHPRQYELFFEKYTKHIKTLNVDVVLQEKGFTPHKNVQKRKRKLPGDEEENAFQKRKKKLPGDEEENACKIETDRYIMEEEKMQQTVKINTIQSKDLSDDELEIEHVESKVPVEESQKNIEKSLIISKEVDKAKTAEMPNQIQLNQQQVYNPIQKESQQKIKPQQKTGLQYDSDYQAEEDSPKIAYVQIPQQILMLAQKERNNINFCIPSSSSILPHMPSQKSLFSYRSNFQNNFPPTYPMPSSSFSNPIEQGYMIQIKQLDQQKQWHLNQANKCYMEMSQHFQKANGCDQNKQLIMKQMMEIKRTYFYPNNYSTQY